MLFSIRFYSISHASFSLLLLLYHDARARQEKWHMHCRSEPKLSFEMVNYSISKRYHFLAKLLPMM